jgi:hypothetical protein
MPPSHHRWVRPPAHSKVSAVEFVPNADVTGLATNGLDLELRDRGPDGSLNILLATLALGRGVNASRRQAQPITLTSGAPTALEGDQLEWHQHHRDGQPHHDEKGQIPHRPLLLSLRRATEGVAFPIRAAHVHPDDAALG